MRNEFYKGTNGAILVYDVTDRTSFENMSVWLSEMKSHVIDESNNIIIVVCANKVSCNSCSHGNTTMMYMYIDHMIYRLMYHHPYE